MAGKHATPALLPLGTWRRIWFALAALLGAAAVVWWMTLIRPDPRNGADLGLLVPPPSAPASTGLDLPTAPVSPPAGSPSAVPAVSATPATGTPEPRRTAAAGTPAPAVTATTAVTPGARPVPIPEQTTAPTPRTTLAAAPTAAPTTTSPPAPAATASYRMASSWSSGFVSEVRVTNTSSRTSTWTVTVTHAGADGVTVQHSWNSSFRQSGAVTVFSGGPLAPGAAVTFGYQAAKRVSGRATPTGCTIGGAACGVS